MSLDTADTTALSPEATTSAPAPAPHYDIGEVLYTRPRFKPTLTLEVGREFTLFPISDVHWPDHEAGLLAEWRNEVLATPNSYVALVGDMFEKYRTKVQKFVRTYTEDETFVNGIEEGLLAEVKTAADFFRPLADRIIAIVPGNHGWTFRNGHTLDEQLALELGVWDKYSREFALVRFTFINDQQRFALFHHTGGSNGGGTKSGDENRFRKVLASRDSDIVCLGHTHRMFSANGTASTSGGRQWRRNSQGDMEPWDCLFVNCGTFKRDEYDYGYAGARLLGPADRGWMRVRGELRTSGDVVIAAQRVVR